MHTATRAVYVENKDGKEVRLTAGQSADLDGRKYNDSHIFVKAGYLVPDDEKPKRASKPKQETAKADSKQEDAKGDEAE